MKRYETHVLFHNPPAAYLLSFTTTNCTPSAC